MNRFFFAVLVFFSQISEQSASMTHFSFSDDPIDVVIPSVEKDLLTLELCVEGIRKNGVNVRRIIVVSKKPLTEKAEWFDEAKYPFSFDDVERALSREDPERREALVQKGRTGWYYQQLLKLYAPFVIPDISSNVLILDSDAIFLNPTTFLDGNNVGMYNPGVEYHVPYFHHGARLIPGFRKCFPDYSGVSHHMIFQKPVIDAIFEEVESLHGEPFWKVFCHLVASKDLIHSGASEYELYLNYVFSHTDQVSIRCLKWRNLTHLGDMEQLRREGFHYICCHSFDR